MKFFKNKTFPSWLPALVFGTLGTLVGAGVSTLFPGGDTWLYDRLVAQQASPHLANPSIILVTLEENGPASCGASLWNTTTLAQTISSLNQAQAKVIAPALTLGLPTSPECGDIAGLAKLIEATKQAGNVVYPSSVPEALASEATRIGAMNLEPDEDGIFRRIPLNVLGADSELLPFGLAIASRSATGLQSASMKDGMPSFVGRWTDHPFPTFSFSQIWELVTTRDLPKLSAIVKNKFVVLFPIGTHAVTLSTPLETAAPVGFLHANLLQSALADSWVKKLSWKKELGTTLVLAMLVAWLPLQFGGAWGLVSVALLLLTRLI